MTIIPFKEIIQLAYDQEVYNNGLGEYEKRILCGFCDRLLPLLQKSLDENNEWNLIYNNKVSISN